MSSLPPRPPSTEHLPLAPGWTEHKAPTGHKYYYNAATKQSTYTRPVATGPSPVTPAPPPPPAFPAYSAYPQQQYQAPPRQSGPLPYVPFEPYQPPQKHEKRLATGAEAGYGLGLPTYKLEPTNTSSRTKKKGDSPKRKRVIPGAHPWVIVITKAGRQFVHNLDTRISLWKAPEEVQKWIDRMPEETEESRKEERIARRIRKAREGLQKMEEQRLQAMGRLQPAQAKAGAASATGANSTPAAASRAIGGGGGGEAAEFAAATERVFDNTPKAAEDDVDLDLASDEEYVYEEDEVEAKRAKMAHQDDQPVEFTEEDIAWQLAQMQEEGGEYEEEEYYEEEEQVDPMVAINTFKEMLLELNVNPYGTWDSELNKIIDDDRYTALDTTKKRKEVFLEWCKDRIAYLKAEKEKEKKIDPKIPYLNLLVEKATGKLYWPEFKRKYRKEQAMKDIKLSDKEREKLFRDYVSHLKISPALRENDLKKLLRSIPLSQLNASTTLTTLPDSILTDIRYHVFSPDPSKAPSTKLRDELITQHIATLGPAPENNEDEEAAKAKEEEKRKEMALREREERVRREKMKTMREIGAERMNLESSVREVEEAKRIRVGLRGYLDVPKEEGEE
ncbi:hypothetical protein BJ508DRAFT_223434 [Ascobolus immersus RN42]|uniref:WW domain-containing protein n=1 Tax=Ascobolus immersus RN42 TaxID=1160509 RepID=A0A3N4IDZ1_ASCIM|nr:hypothetical protein BJ508DRAFT_223434 [Ascobolus immersus RN42]